MLPRKKTAPSRALTSVAKQSRVKAAGLYVKTNLAAERPPSQDVQSPGRASRALGSRDWRSSESTPETLCIAAPEIPKVLRVHMIAGDMTVTQVQSRAEAIDWRKPQPAAAWDAITSAPPSKTCFSASDLEKLTSRPLLVKDVKPVVVENADGNVVKLPNTFACEVTNAEMKYISGGMQGLSLAELKRLQNGQRCQKPSMEWDVEELRSVMKLSTPANRATMLGPRRSASVSPEFLTRCAGERHGEVSTARKLERIMESDPAIESINGVESPNRRNRPTQTEAKRFDTMFSRLHPPMSDGNFTKRLLECQPHTVGHTNPSKGSVGFNTLSDSGYGSEPPSSAVVSELFIISDSSISSPGKWPKLDPTAAEFHSFLPSPKKRLTRGKIANLFPEAPAPQLNLNHVGPSATVSPGIPFGAELLTSPPFTSTPSPLIDAMTLAATFNTFAGQLTPPIAFSLPGSLARGTKVPFPPLPQLPQQQVPPATQSTCYPLPEQGHAAAMPVHHTMIGPSLGPSLGPYSPRPMEHMSMPVQEPTPGPMESFQHSCSPLATAAQNHSIHGRSMAYSGPADAPRPFFPVTQKPRDHDPLKQQQYEAYIEWRKANEPGFAAQCKVRQARRFARQLGSSMPA